MRHSLSRPSLSGIRGRNGHKAMIGQGQGSRLMACIKGGGEIVSLLDIVCNKLCEHNIL